MVSIARDRILKVRSTYDRDGAFPVLIRTRRIAEVLALADQLREDVNAISSGPDQDVSMGSPVETEKGVGLFFYNSYSEDLAEQALDLVAEAIATVDDAAKIVPLPEEVCPLLDYRNGIVPAVTLMALANGDGGPTWYKWRTDEDAFDALIARGVEWWSELDGTVWLNQDDIHIRASAEFAKHAVSGRGWSDRVYAVSVARDGSSARVLDISAKGRIYLTWTEFIMEHPVAMAEELRSIAVEWAPKVIYAQVARNTVTRRHWGGWATMRPSNVPYPAGPVSCSRKVPDVVGIQVLSSQHELPEVLPDGWRVTPTPGGRRLLESDGLADWFEVEPSPEQLLANRGQFRSLLMDDDR